MHAGKVSKTLSIFRATMVGMLAFTGCTTSSTVDTGMFVDVATLESRFVRGVTTKADIQTALGTPDGRGEALMPSVPSADEVWFYDNIEMTGTKQVGDVLRIEGRQQILLVFLKDSRFDGFMWYSDELKGSAQ